MSYKFLGCGHPLLDTMKRRLHCHKHSETWTSDYCEALAMANLHSRGQEGFAVTGCLKRSLGLSLSLQNSLKKSSLAREERQSQAFSGGKAEHSLRVKEIISFLTCRRQLFLLDVSRRFMTARSPGFIVYCSRLFRVAALFCCSKRQPVDRRIAFRERQWWEGIMVQTLHTLMI